MLCSPDLTLRHSKLVEEERPQQRHGFLPLLAIPERPHVRFALPQRDRVACVWVALVSRQPLALEPLHISPQGCCLLVGSFKPVPLAGSDSSPNDTHVHVRLLLCVLPVSQTHRPSHSAAHKAHWLAFQATGELALRPTVTITPSKWNSRRALRKPDAAFREPQTL